MCKPAWCQKALFILIYFKRIIISFADPSPVQLIVQFLQQADAHVVKEPLPPIHSGDNGSIEQHGNKSSISSITSTVHILYSIL